MSTITFDVAAFRVAFPQFADPTAFPNVWLQAQFDVATGFVSNEIYGCMTVAIQTYCLQLMTAHLLAIGVIIASGNYTGTPGIVTGSKVGDVSVTLAQPPYGTDDWRYWLMLTPYGAQLLALLSAQAVGGFYIGGLPERAAFRKVGGIF